MGQPLETRKLGGRKSFLVKKKKNIVIMQDLMENPPSSKLNDKYLNFG